MGVGVRITHKNLAKEGSWRPKWHPTAMTETASIGRIGMTKTSRRRKRRRRRRLPNPSKASWRTPTYAPTSWSSC